MSLSDSDHGQLSNLSGVTTWLIVLLIIELIGMSWYTYLDVQRQMRPASLVDRAEEAIRRNYPEIRRKIKRDVEENAPAIAEKISDEAVASSPEVRQWLERATARQLESGLDQATDLSAEQFRMFLQDNREQVKQAFEQMDDAPEQTRKLVLDLEEQMDEQLGVELQKQARAALERHRQLNTKLERLSSDAPLEPKELLERRIIRISRTLAEQRLSELPDLDMSANEKVSAPD